MGLGGQAHTLEDDLDMMEDDLDMMEDDPKMYKIYHYFLSKLLSINLYFIMWLDLIKDNGKQSRYAGRRPRYDGRQP